MTLIDPTTERAQRRVGQTLRQKWRLDKLLGVGGMAAVYAGTHRNGSRGAIKMLHLELSTDAEIRQRFLREGYAANTVDHPGVVKVLDDDMAEDGSVFVVMELLEGETLEHRWQSPERRGSLGDLLSFADALLDVLEAAHRKGIVHRDIKPENIFLTTNDQLKLLDFGIARLREGSATATKSGITMGTPAFMPPEQALGRSDEVGPGTDLWAVGAVLFYLLSGRFVHEGQSGNEQLVMAATQTAPALRSVVPSIPSAVAEVVDRALRFRPAERYSSAAEMQAALRGVLPRLGPEASARQIECAAAPLGALSRVLPSIATRRTRGERGPWVAGAVALVLVGLTAGRFWVARPAPELASAESIAPSVSLPVASASAALPPANSAPEAAASSPVAAATGELEVEVKGGECELLFDDVSLGRAARKLVLSTPGEHQLACGTGPKQQVFVRAGETTRVSMVVPRVAPPVRKTEPEDPRDRRK